jgi:hypothetical protein
VLVAEALHLGGQIDSERLSFASHFHEFSGL